MEKKKFFKNKKQMLIYIFIFCLLIYGFIYLGTKNYDTKKGDHEKFDSQFSLVDDNNVYTYINSNDAKRLLNAENTIIFFGTSNSEWVNYYAKILNDVALKSGVKNINYYDFFEDRKNANGTYESIVEKLSKYATVDDEGKKNIYAPSLLVIKDSNIIYFDNETSITQGDITPEVYWNEYQTGLKTSILTEIFSEYVGNQDGK
jgi:hypothetical protein